MEKMKGGVWLGLLSLLLAPALRAQTPEEWFARGNAAYAEGDFTKAREAYERITAQRIGGANLHYNLGNACYRLGRTGYARLWYERALREDPAHEDARYNRDLLLSQIQESEPDTVLSRLAGRRDTVRLGLLAVNTLFFGCMALAIFRREEWVWWAKWISGILFAAGAVLLWLAGIEGNRAQAVILELRAEVRAGPGPEHRVDFVAPEGQKVALFETRDGWTQIGVPSKNLKGWVRASAVEPIQP